MWESSYGWQAFFYAAEVMTNCPFMGGVHQHEESWFTAVVV